MGKTAALYHAVHHARRAGWVVLLVPSAYEYLHEGGLVRPSPFFKGYFDTVRAFDGQGWVFVVAEPTITRARGGFIFSIHSSLV